MDRESASPSSPPLPPDELIDRVTPGLSEENAGALRAGFQASGPESVEDLDRTLAAIGRSLNSYPRILEFGCGCGRILGWLGPLAEQCELHGTDIDEAAIAWCQENLPFAEFGVNPHEPPMRYADASFDLVFNHSVLTHLDERYQDLWLAELRRITKPGGTVVLTVHGDVGSVFPDFYHSTFHAPWYVFEHWAAFFNLRVYLTRAALGYQDVIVLERPREDTPAPRPVRARPGSAVPT